MRKNSFFVFIGFLCFFYSTAALAASGGMQLRLLVDEKSAASTPHDQHVYTLFSGSGPQNLFVDKEWIASNVDVECVILIKKQDSSAVVSTPIVFIFTDEGAERMRGKVREKLKTEPGKIVTGAISLFLDDQISSVGIGIFLSTGTTLKPTIIQLPLPMPEDQALKLLRKAGFEPVIYGETDKIPVYQIPQAS